MKFLFLLPILMLSSVAQAKCVVAFTFYNHDGAYSRNLLKDRDSSKIISIMNSKGYKVVSNSDGSEDYSLFVSSRADQMCGYASGVASLKDKLTISTAYRVTFKVSNGNEIFEQKETFEKLNFTFPSFATRRALLNAVKKIPACD